MNEREQYTELWPGWKTVRKIGTGSYGAVYEAERVVFGNRERAALKVLSIPQRSEEIEEMLNEGYEKAVIADLYKSYLEDIGREYSTMAKMKGHSNIVNCDDIRSVPHEDGFGWNIVIKMELLTPLMRVLDRVCNEREVIQLGIDMCSALVVCRHHGIIHRDIKPQNILLSPDGNYKLGDFGIAKTAERTSSGTKAGTYKFMAPEVYNNQPYGSSADIYSLGLVMYWMMNDKRTPFLPEPPKLATALEDDTAKRRRFAGEALPLPRHGSAELHRIILKACEPNPTNRYETAAQMMQDLLVLQANGGFAVRDKQIFVPEEPVPQPEPKQQEPEDKEWYLHITPPPEEDDITIRTVPYREEAPPPPYPAEAAVARKRRPKTDRKKLQPVIKRPQDPEVQRKRLLVVVIASVAVALVLGCLVVLLGGRGPQPADQLEQVPEMPTEPDPGTPPEWSDWLTVLPDFVTGDRYTVETRTVYSSRTRQIRDSTTELKEDGWECFDVIEGTGDFGKWSDWQDGKIKEAPDRQVATAQRYRSRKKETKVSEEKSMPGWTQEKAETRYGDFGSWSDWQNNPISASDNLKVETRTQYSSRSVKVTQNYSDWSGWGSWKNSRENTGDTKKEDTRSVWGYYYYRCPSCGAHMAAKGTCELSKGGCGADISSGSYVEIWSTTAWDSAGLSSWYGTGYSYGYIDGSMAFSSGKTATQYRYATRTGSEQTSYGDWSGWSDTAVSPSATLEVRTRTQYRSAARAQTQVYQYSRWGQWSAWSETAITPGADTEVETKTVYRSRERIYTKTYYYRRWLDWTDYTDEPVEPSENVEVSQRTLYRYIRKENG